MRLLKRKLRLLTSKKCIVKSSLETDGSVLEPMMKIWNNKYFPKLRKLVLQCMYLYVVQYLTIMDFKGMKFRIRILGIWSFHFSILKSNLEANKYVIKRLKMLEVASKQPNIN